MNQKMPLRGSQSLSEPMSQVEASRNEPTRDKPYSASSIRVLTDQEAEDRMPWLKAETLAAEYGQPLDFVKRLLRSCHVWDVDLAVRKYLKGEKGIVTPPEVLAIHADIVAVESRGFAKR